MYVDCGLDTFAIKFYPAKIFDDQSCGTDDGSPFKNFLPLFGQKLIKCVGKRVKVYYENAPEFFRKNLIVLLD